MKTKKGKTLKELLVVDKAKHTGRRRGGGGVVKVMAGGRKRKWL